MIAQGRKGRSDPICVARHSGELMVGLAGLNVPDGSTTYEHDGMVACT